MQLNVRLAMLFVAALILNLALSSVHSTSLTPTNDSGEGASYASARAKDPKLPTEAPPSEFCIPARVSGVGALIRFQADANFNSQALTPDALANSGGPASRNPAFSISDLLNSPSRPLPASSLAQTVDITVGSFGDLGFSPQTVNINVGDTVNWNWDTGGHNVISGNSCNADNKFCSPNNTNCSSAPISGSGFIYTRTFNEAGSFPYFCGPHCSQGMTGLIIVGAAPTPTPTPSPSPSPTPTPAVLPTIQFSQTSYSKPENGPSTNITVTRSGDTSGTSSVNFGTGNNGYVACNVISGSAVQNCDFILSSGTLNFAAGQTSRTFPVIINDDSYVEGNETLSLTLSNPVGATLGTPNPATLTITDNDSPAPSPGPKTFVAALSSSQEVPPTGTTGKGGGVVQLDGSETGAKVGLIFSTLSSSQTEAHIHGPAAVGVNGPILFPLPMGTVIDHSISPTVQQVSDMKAGLHYLNVHSSNFIGGEIRGQLLWNPLNESQYLVQQHYYDFLGRLPDQGGLDFWVNELTVCGISVQCLRDRTVGVSNAFFYEQEYQQTASYVFLLYRASYGNDQPPPNNPDPNVTEAKKLPRYLTFVRDRAQVVGGTDLATSQRALANAFVQRPEFVAKYPSSLATGADFVNAVRMTIQSASGVDLSSQSATLITHFNNGGRGLVMFHLANDYWNGCERLPGSPAAPCVPAGFGAAVDNRPFIDAEYNRSFVYSQYSGYLRRDGDIGGFLFWLNQVSTAPPRNVGKQKAMVCAFITSDEYQFRFGDKAPRNNAECIP